MVEAAVGVVDVAVAGGLFLRLYIPGLFDTFFPAVLLLLLWIGSFPAEGGGGPAGSTERGLGRIYGLLVEAPRGFAGPLLTLLL